MGRPMDVPKHSAREPLVDPKNKQKLHINNNLYII